MNKFLLAAPSSGSGKTTVTCAVLSALHRRGKNVHAFKCGPDYIDPMFHRAALGIPCHNLDLYLTPEDRLKQLFRRYAEGADVTVAEGVMGFYDGVGGVTPEASAWHVADVLDLPVVLVVRPHGASLSLSSLVNGFRTVPGGAAELARRSPALSSHSLSANVPALDSHLHGILLSDCSEMLYRALKPMLEEETGLPVLGFLPHLEEARFESRHLGLVTAEEDPDLQKKIELLADAAETYIDLDALLALGAEEVPQEKKTQALHGEASSCDLRIAVASDEAFAFCYDETLDAFRDAGMKPVLFSPLRDAQLPEHVDALYLPGGYPELHAKELSDNESMRASIRMAIQSGLPTIAECGGFLYLGESLKPPAETASFPMVGIYPGAAEKTNRPVRFGYAELQSNEDTLVAPAGTPVRVHNFHYYESSARGDTYCAVKPVSGRTYETGYGTEHSYFGFPHLYFAGNPELCERLAEAARSYRTGGNNQKIDGDENNR